MAKADTPGDGKYILVIAVAVDHRIGAFYVPFDEGIDLLELITAPHNVFDKPIDVKTAPFEGTTLLCDALARAPTTPPPSGAVCPYPLVFRGVPELPECPIFDVTGQFLSVPLPPIPSPKRKRSSASDHGPPDAVSA